MKDADSQRTSVDHGMLPHVFMPSKASTIFIFFSIPIRFLEISEIVSSRMKTIRQSLMTQSVYFMSNMYIERINGGIGISCTVMVAAMHTLQCLFKSQSMWVFNKLIHVKMLPPVFFQVIRCDKASVRSKNVSNGSEENVSALRCIIRAWWEILLTLPKKRNERIDGRHRSSVRLFSPKKARQRFSRS